MPRYPVEPWEYRGYFPPSRPLAAKGGIKARSKIGKFTSSWWGQQWITVLESFDLGSRLTRGRRYARSGQVLHLEITAGKAVATVQGSRPIPYEVSIAVRQIPNPKWRAVCRAIAQNISVAAKLTTGEMPAQVETCFSDAGVALFPKTHKDLETWCTCPDMSNPCKHIAAVYYLLAEEFDRDPFLLFALRGIGRDEFMALLGTSAASNEKGTDEPAREIEWRAGTPAPLAETPAPLTVNPERFWRGAPVPEDVLGEVQVPTEAAPLTKRLGPFPFWRGDTDFLGEISRCSWQAAHRGLEVFLKRAQ